MRPEVLSYPNNFFAIVATCLPWNAAIPSSWWTDDPDYVDSWYTLGTGSSGRLHGASGNGWLDVVPHFVEEL